MNTEEWVRREIRRLQCENRVIIGLVVLVLVLGTLALVLT